MSYKDGAIKNYQKVKKNNCYPQPSKDKPNRKINIFTDDILIRTKPGVFTRSVGGTKQNILIPEEDIINVDSGNIHSNKY